MRGATVGSALGQGVARLACTRGIRPWQTVFVKRASNSQDTPTFYRRGPTVHKGCVGGDAKATRHRKNDEADEGIRDSALVGTEFQDRGDYFSSRRRWAHGCNI